VIAPAALGRRKGPRIRICVPEDEPMNDPARMDQLDESQYPPELRLPDRESTLDVVWGMQQRDPVAEQAFIDRFVPILRRRAHHRLSQRARRVHDTEDIVQSALYDFLKYLSQMRLEHSGVVEACLLTILKRELVRAERGAWNRAELVEPEVLDEVPDFAPLPSSSYARRIEEAMRRVALRGLGEQERRAIELKLEGKKPGEIALELGMVEGDTSRALIRRAFNKFQEAYARIENPGGKNS
jgi:RNA polymerase sigma factor (sigma-70 family)